MVAPFGNLVNKLSFSSTNINSSNTAPNTKSSIPTMSSANDIGMDIPMGQVSNTESKGRGRNSFSPIHLSRESSMALSGRSTPYHERMNIDTDPTNKELNPELSYKAEQEKAIWVSMAANQQETTRPSSVHNEAPQFVLNTRKKFLISNFLMTHMPLLNLNYGVDLSTPFLSMVLLNTLLWILRISKYLSISWPSTSGTNRL